jgi:signal peptidase I
MQNPFPQYQSPEHYPHAPIPALNKPTQVLLQVLNFVSVLASGLMIWKGLGLLTNTESPIVVVLRYVSSCALCLIYARVTKTTFVAKISGSMEPAFYRGDLLFLTNPPSQRYNVGDITVYQLPHGGIPIVHRVLETRDVSASSKWVKKLSAPPASK